MSSYVQRVATRAADIDVVRVLLTILASPLYVVGMLVGVLWLVVVWAFAAVATGFDDGRRGTSRPDDA